MVKEGCLMVERPSDSVRKLAFRIRQLLTHVHIYCPRRRKCKTVQKLHPGRHRTRAWPAVAALHGVHVHVDVRSQLTLFLLEVPAGSTPLAVCRMVGWIALGDLA
jgi:hypothetical protein